MDNTKYFRIDEQNFHISQNQKFKNEKLLHIENINLENINNKFYN